MLEAHSDPNFTYLSAEEASEFMMKLITRALSDERLAEELEEFQLTWEFGIGYVPTDDLNRLRRWL